MRTWTDIELIEHIQNSNSYSELFKKLKLVLTGKSLQFIKTHIDRLDLDTNHFRRYARKRRNLTFEDIFKENSDVKSTTLRLWARKHIPYICAKCKNPGFKNGESLTLQLDHENGVNNDNRKENLRYLCPDCHTQTPTYSRRKNQQKCGRKVKKQTVFSDPQDEAYVKMECDCCDRIYYRLRSRLRAKSKIHEFAFCSGRCSAEYQSISRKNDYQTHGTLGAYFRCPKPRCEPCKKAMREWKASRRGIASKEINWPTDSDLQKLVWEKPITLIAKELGVSDNAVLKRCRRNRIETHEVGYWTRVRYEQSCSL